MLSRLVITFLPRSKRLLISWLQSPSGYFATSKNEGYNFVNVGVLSSQEDFINAAVETNADMILVSSLYGHGEIDCRGMREKCIEAGIGDIFLYVGGNIVVGKQNFDEVKARFLKMGFNRVFPPGTPIEEDLPFIKEDLGE